MAMLCGILAADEKRLIPAELIKFTEGERGTQALRDVIKDRPALPSLDVCRLEHTLQGEVGLICMLSCIDLPSHQPVSPDVVKYGQSWIED